MKTAKLFVSILGLFIILPISMYVQYSILQTIHADRLLFFLFWVNVPAVFFVQIVLQVLEAIGKESQ